MKYLYHGTRGPLVNIIMEEGLKADSGYSNFGGQAGISTTTDERVAYRFGNRVIVLDAKKLASHYDLTPTTHPSASDEKEIRVTSKRGNAPTVIPPSFIVEVRGKKIPKFEIKWWERQYSVPLVSGGAMNRTQAERLTEKALRVIAGVKLKRTKQIAFDHVQDWVDRYEGTEWDT